MATRRLLYAGAALLSFICWAQNLSDSFIDPSGPDLSAEKNYTIGQIIKLQWSTSYDNISLCLIQYDHDEDCELLEGELMPSNKIALRRADLNLRRPGSECRQLRVDRQHNERLHGKSALSFRALQWKQ